MKLSKANQRKQDDAERDELKKILKSLDSLVMTSPWETRNADLLYKICIKAKKLHEKWVNELCFS